MKVIILLIDYRKFNTFVVAPLRERGLQTPSTRKSPNLSLFYMIVLYFILHTSIIYKVIIESLILIFAAGFLAILVTVNEG